MANFVYDAALTGFPDGSIDWDSDTIRLMLVDSTTTADTETAAATISAFTTLGELSGTGYVRKDLASKTVTIDVANARAELDAADVSFAAITAGTAAAAVVFKFVSNDADSVPIAFFDGQFTVTAAAPASATDVIVFVEPLLGPIANSTAILFSGGTTATLTAAASTGDRSLTVSALPGAIAIAETSSVTANITGNFPLPTNGGNLTLAVNVEGLIQGRRRT